MLVLSDQEVERRWAAIITDIEPTDPSRRERWLARATGRALVGATASITAVALWAHVHSVIADGLASLSRTIFVR